MFSFCWSFNLQNIYVFNEKEFIKKNKELFYQYIIKKRNPNEKMRIQTDQELQQNEIKELDLKCNIKIFSTKFCGGKAFAAEQIICDFWKNTFWKQKYWKEKKNIELRKNEKVNPKEPIKKARSSLNYWEVICVSKKYDFPLEGINYKSTNNSNFSEILKIFLTLTEDKTRGFIANFLWKKNSNKRVIVKSTTHYALSQK